jgi:hypothetical protein
MSMARNGGYRHEASVFSLIVLVGLLIASPSPVRAESKLGQPPSLGGLLKDSQTFPVTPVGSTSTLCKAVCFLSDPSANSCDRSGTTQLNHSPAAPFSAYDYRLKMENEPDDCTGGTPVQLPAFVSSGQKLDYRVSFSPSTYGTFSDYLDLSGYVLSLTGSTPRGTSSLIPYTPQGWSAPVVVSDTPGRYTDSPNITSSEPLYVSWAVKNSGDLATTSRFPIDLLVDGRLQQEWEQVDNILPNYGIYVADYKIGPLAPGTHTIDLQPDPLNATLGSRENYTKVFTVGQSTPPLPPKPSTTHSWYVRALGKYATDSALNQWAIGAGEQAGLESEASGDASLIILDLGKPWSDNKGGYGTTGFATKRHLTLAEVSTVAKHFLLSYGAQTEISLTLAIGTSNDGSSVSSAHAQAWARMLIQLDVWIKAEGLNVSIASASDAEIGYNTPQVTKAWFQSVSSELAKSNRTIISLDYGDAQGCVRTQATAVPGKCDMGWTQKDIADLFAFYVPQLYNLNTSLEWEQISLYMDLRSGTQGSLIRGPLTEIGACTPPTRAGCAGALNTPIQAWNQTARALRSNAILAPGLDTLMWSTDIGYNQ